MIEEAEQRSDSDTRMVIMTTPSLDPRINLSGISTVVRGLMMASRQPQNSFNWRIVPSTVGKRDQQGRGIGWLVSQVSVLTKFYCDIRRNGPVIVHINGPLSPLAVVRDAVLIRIAQLFPTQIVYHLHGGAFVHSPPSSRILCWIIVSSLRRPSRILVLSDHEATSVVQIYKVAPERIGVLHNAVNVPDICPVKSNEGSLRVLSIGRLSPEKGLSILCDAVEAEAVLKESLELRMYGAGDTEDEITGRLATSLGANFSFGGVADEVVRAHAYAWADVVVMPSIWEGLPMVMLEAMASGVVPVATPVGSIPEVLKDGDNGIMVEKESPKSLAQGLLQALALKRSGALCRISQNAHRTMLGTYSLYSQGRALDQIYAELMK